MLSLTTAVGGAASGATGAGGASGAVTLQSGVGGATTDTNAGVETGGAGGTLTLTGGAGGAIDNLSTGTAGAGADVNITAGAGGAADASSSTGGAGGDMVFTAGTGGVSSSGTAGAHGRLILRSNVTAGSGLPILISREVAQTGTTSTDATEAQVLSGIYSVDPGGDITWTLVTGTELDTALGGSANIANGDSFDLAVINTDATAGAVVTVAGDTGTTLIGDGNVQAVADTATLSVSSGLFRFISTGTNTWNVYRIA